MYSDDDILQELRRVAARLGQKSVSHSEFRRHSKISVNTVSDHFGSWNAAVDAAGLVPISPGPQIKGKRIDDEELLLDLMRLYKEYGKPPNNQCEHITIEFEYRSSGFKDHGHDPDQCDVVVCWIHDWDDCPVEVLELRDAIRYL